PSAALAYRFTLAPHARETVGVVVPLSGRAAVPATDVTAGAGAQSAWLEREERTVAATWKQKLNRVRFRVPREAQPLLDTLHTALAQLLIHRTGPVILPGT